MEFRSDHGEKPTTREEKAAELLREAHHAQMNGAMGNAVHLYQESLQMHPTAEAHTFLGWTYSFLRRYEEAIKSVRTLSPSIRILVTRTMTLVLIS